MRYQDIVAISDSVGANDQPSVSIRAHLPLRVCLLCSLLIDCFSTVLAGIAAASASLPVYSEHSLSANISDTRQAFSGQLQPSNYKSNMKYRWLSVSSTCGASELSSTSTPTIQFSFNALSTSTVRSDMSLANVEILMCDLTAGRALCFGW